MQGVNKAFYKNLLVLVMGATLASGHVVLCSEPSYCSDAEEANASGPIRMKEGERRRDVMPGSKSDSELHTLRYKRERTHESVRHKDEEDTSDKESEGPCEGKRTRRDTTRIRKKPNTLGKIVGVAAVIAAGYGCWRLVKRIFS